MAPQSFCQLCLWGDSLWQMGTRTACLLFQNLPAAIKRFPILLVLEELLRLVQQLLFLSVPGIANTGGREIHYHTGSICLTTNTPSSCLNSQNITISNSIHKSFEEAIFQ